VNNFKYSCCFYFFSNSINIPELCWNFSFALSTSWTAGSVIVWACQFTMESVNRITARVDFKHNAYTPFQVNPNNYVCSGQLTVRGQSEALLILSSRQSPYKAGNS